MASGGKQPAGPFWPWLSLGLANVTQHWGENGETGVDMGLPVGTPVTSLTGGTVQGHGYYGGGGVVSVGCFINNQASTVYYQHLDLVAPAIDQATTPVHVQPGDLIGWSGGQLNGGHHPSTAKFSSGPHLEVGVNAPYGGIWGPHPGKNYDPEPWLRHLEQQNHPDGSPLDSFGQWIQTRAGGGVQVQGQNGWLPFLQEIDSGESLTGFDITNPFGSVFGMIEGVLVRGLIVLVGVVLLLAVINNIANSGLLQPVTPPAWMAGLLPAAAESAAI